MKNNIIRHQLSRDCLSWNAGFILSLRLKCGLSWWFGVFLASKSNFQRVFFIGFLLLCG
jgi:hypothetical protein